LRIELFTKPGVQIVHQARELERICQAHDHLEGSLYLDPSMNLSPEAPSLLALFEGETLAGAMTFFAPTQEEAELVSLTHPDFRRRGVFRALVQEAARQAVKFGIPDFLFVCEPQSKDGVAALHWFTSKPDHTEYALRYDRTLPPEHLKIPTGLTMHRATETDLPDMVQISSDSFSEEAERAAHFLGLAIVSETRRQYLFRLDGVRTHLQNRGIGRGIVALLLRECYAQGTEDILIEVDNTNAPAHHLYLSCGFVQEAIYDYLRAPIAQFLPKQA